MEYLFRGKCRDGVSHKVGEWVYGDLGHVGDKRFIDNSHRNTHVDPESVGQYVWLNDKTERKIFEGDVVRLVLPNGEVRHFEVVIKTVKRKVKSHPDFDAPFAEVFITGVVFCWNGFDLFPCVDNDGVSDVAKMEIVGNVHDHPDLLGKVRP